MPDNQFWRDASNRLTFEMFRVPPKCFADICKDVSAAFQMVPHTPVIAGMDVVFVEFQRENAIIDFAWDNWSGFTVIAKNPEAETLVQEIAAYLLTSGWATAD